MPALSGAIQEASSLINPLQDWVSEEIEICPDGGCYVGNKPLDERMEPLSEDKRLLYPAYLGWCKRRFISSFSHVNFSNSLLSVLTSLGERVERLRKRGGSFLSGVTLKEDTYGFNYKLGFKEKQKDHEGPQPSVVLQKEVVLQEVVLQRPPKDLRWCLSNSKSNLVLPSHAQSDVLPSELYVNYSHRLSERNPVKDLANRASREMSKDSCEGLVDEYLQGIKSPSKDYRESVSRVVEKGIQKIQRFGAIPYSYRIMCASPRILPVAYKESINSTKKLVRRKAYTLMSQALKEQGYIIVDFDLKILLAWQLFITRYACFFCIIYRSCFARGR